MFKYLRYCLMFPLLAVALVGLAWGGPWMWLGLAVTLGLMVGGDELLDPDPTLQHFSHPGLLNAMTFCTLPFVVAMSVLLVWMCAPAGDPLQLGAWIRSVTGWDLIAAREQTRPAHLVGGVLSTVLLTGIGGINMAHEMLHRSDTVTRLWSRVLQIFSYEVPGHIVHLSSHHVRVCMPDDPSTARRGESSYAFVLRAIVSGNLYGWRTEAARLRRQGVSPLHWDNRFLRGHALSVLATVVAYWMSGWVGAAVFVVTANLTKSLLELINYIQHYGLVRAEGSAIGIRHSWNSNRKMSTYILCNATRHSHHHAEPAMPFWLLQPFPQAPTLRFGYLTCVLFALVPPLWYRLMAKPLQAWDQRHATPEERALAREANLRSGMAPLAASN